MADRGAKIDNLVECLRLHARKQRIERVSRLQDGLYDEPATFLANFDLLTDIQRSSRHDGGGDADCRTIAPFFHLNRSEEHTSELQSLMRISYAVFCLKKKT